MIFIYFPLLHEVPHKSVYDSKKLLLDSFLWMECQWKDYDQEMAFASCY